MRMKLFEEVREILVRQLAVKPEVVNLQSKIVDDLGADSLDAMEIVSDLEEAFGVKVTEEEMRKIVIVTDAVELVSQKLQAKAIT